MKLKLTLVVVGLSALACGKSGDSISCYVDSQQICYEVPSPSSTQRSNLEVKCSSVSGAFKNPAACPQAGQLGKCTFTGPDGLEVDRFYTGRDASYEQSYCETVNTGTWSTAF